MIKVRFLIIDDHPLIQFAIKQTLISEFPESEIYLASSFAEAAMLIKTKNFDLVLLDLFISCTDKKDPFQNARELNQYGNHTKFCIISAAEQTEYVQQAFSNGLCGFLPKSIDSLRLIAAINIMLSGGCYFPHSLISKVQGIDLRRKLEWPSSRITNRQSAVIDLLIAGHPNKTNAKELGITLQTVKAHLTAIMAALGVENRTQLALAVTKFDQQYPSWRMRQHSDISKN